MGGSIGRLSWGGCSKCPWYMPLWVTWEKDFSGPWEHMFNSHGELMPTREKFKAMGFKRLVDYPMPVFNHRYLPAPTPGQPVKTGAPDPAAWETVKENVRKEKAG